MREAWKEIDVLDRTTWVKEGCPTSLDAEISWDEMDIYNPLSWGKEGVRGPVVALVGAVTRAATNGKVK